MRFRSPGGMRSRMARALAALSLSTLTTLPTLPVHAETVLRVADMFPGTHIGVQQAKRWMNRATELSGGELKFQYFPSEQLAKAADMLDAVQNGVTDIGFVVPAYVTDRMPLSTVVNLPLVGNRNNTLEYQHAFRKLVREMLDPVELRPLGVRAVRAVMTGPYQLLSASKSQPKTLADLKGLRVRVGGGIQEKALARLGMTPVAIAAPDMYTAIQRGTVDGVMFTLLTAGGYRLQEVTKYVSTNINFGLIPNYYVINEKTWQKLSPKAQKALLQADEDMVAGEAADFDAGQVKFLADVEKRKGKVYAFDDAEVAKCRAMLEPLHQEWIADMEKIGKPGRKTFDVWRTAMTK